MKSFRVILFLFIALSSIISKAQNESYIYLEGIKGIAYKVKLNGNIQTQLGRNYMILPIKQMGENTIAIEFGGDLYPTQTYVLDIQEQSSYGYKLAKAGEDKFYLLDLVNNGKIIESNSNINIGLSTIDNGINFYQPKAVVAKTKQLSEEELEEKEVADRIERRRVKELEEKNEIALQEKMEAEKQAALAKEKEDKALAKAAKKQEKELKKQSELAAKKAKEELLAKQKAIEETQAIEAKKKEELGIVEVIQSNENKAKTTIPTTPNARCFKNPSPAEINSFIERLKQKTDDDSKLILLKKKIFTGCVSANQLMQIGEQFETQYGRFSAVKFMHSEMADPENVIQLEPLFRYDSYKSKLRKL